MGLKDVAAKKTPASKKASGIVLEISDEIKQEVDNWVESNRAKKDAEANMEQAESAILEVVQDQWREACKANGSIETSAKVGSIRVSWKGKSQFLTATSLGDGKRAKEVFGEEKYGEYFREMDEYNITPEAANHPEISARLEAALSQIQEEFPDVEIMTVKTKVVATSRLMDEWVLGNSTEVDQNFAAAGIKRTKPTFAQR